MGTPRDPKKFTLFEIQDIWSGENPKEAVKHLLLSEEEMSDL